MPLRILTFNWHEPYICLMAKTGHYFDVVPRLKGGRKDWLVEQRPIPENVTLIREEHALKKCCHHFYDVIICQNVQDLTLVKQFELPKILVFHNKLSTEIALAGQQISKKEVYRQQIQSLIDENGPIHLVFISQAKKIDWGFEGQIITPGIDPSEYGDYHGRWPKVLRVGNFMKERDIMMGFSLQEQILKGLPSTILGLNPSLPESRLSRSWEDLKQAFRRHRLYLNTTVEGYEDGYNLAMLEAMATGMPVVSVANQTSPIRNDMNGFVSNNLNFLHQKVAELLGNMDLARKLGQNARETVIEKFPISKFTEKWNEALEIASQTKPKIRQRIKNHRKKLKILMGWVNYPASTGRYLRDALFQISELLTCGPKMPVETLKQWNLEDMPELPRSNDFPLPCRPSAQEILSALPPGWIPDIFLWVETGLEFFPHGLEHLPAVKACYLIDTHLHLDEHLVWARNFDLVFLAQRQYIHEFQKTGIKNVYWLPLACAPEIHGKKTNNKLYDIGFVGSLTEQKQVELLSKLKRKFNLYYERCFLQRMATVFSQSKIVFNNSIKDDLNMRVFEAMASGSMLLTDEAKGSGLTEMFQDRKHLVIYRNEDELLELADYYLRNDEEREKIAAEGMKEVLEKHTYSHRAKEMLEILSLFVNEKGDKREGMSKGVVTPALTANKEDYYRQKRKDVETLIPDHSMIILDVGCGEGTLGKRLLEKGTKEVVGIEIQPEVSERARGNLSRVICGDIEKIDLPFEEGHFDCIVFADILEHLKAPLSVVKKLKKHLKDSGVVVASIPNVRYYLVINMLVEGHWKYGDYGILDRNHLRFFTKKEIEALFEDAGFEITTITANIDRKYYTISNPPPADISFGRVSLKGLTPEEIKDLFVFQYLIRARKARY